MAQTGVPSWSQTPASNATADPTINYSEGQAPSSINDSARAMMAALRKYFDDITGAIVTTGSSTAYAVTSYTVFDSLTRLNGQMIAFTPHTTNGATVTLNVDGLGAKPLRAFVGVELQSSSLISGTPYIAIYNSSDAAFYLHGNAGGTYGIPLSGFLAYAGSTAPSSAFVFPYGQAISRTTYATLFSLVGSTYGAGDGSTTFNIPDLRGRGVFYKDDMGGSAASRITAGTSGIDAATLGSSGGTETHTLTAAQIPSITSTVSTSGTLSGSTTENVNKGLFPSTTGGGAFAFNGASGQNTSGVSVSGSMTGTATSNNTSGGGHQNMPPAYILNCIMRVI